MVQRSSSLLATVLFLICFNQNFFTQDLYSQFDSNGRPLFQKGVITVKLKERLPQRLTKGAKSFGVSSVDEKLSRYGTTKISKRFNHRSIPIDSELPDLSRIYNVAIPENVDINDVIEELAKDSNVEYAEPIYISYLLEAPDDSLYTLQSHLPQIKAEEAWDIHKSENGSEPVIIGICDTGVQWDHPDLIDNIWQNLGEDADNDGHVIEWADSIWILDPGDRNGIDDDGNGYIDDFVGWNSLEFYGEDPSNPTDPYGHGTHVAGIAAATTNNGIGVAGISWNAKIMTASMSSDLSPYPGYIIDGYRGIIYLAEAGADIINCSWGSGNYRSSASEEAIKYATMLGSIVVCAAGNDASLGIDFPAKYPHVVAVGGVNSDDVKHRFSNYGPSVDVVAPYAIFSTNRIDEYSLKGGTSMSSPLVAGLLALMKSYFPDMSNDKLVERLTYTADNIDHLNPGYENYLGGGRINAYRALTDTTINIPELYRLDIRDISLSSGNSIKAGRESNVYFTVQNFSNYNYKNKVSFYLSSQDPDVEILQNSVLKNLIPDDFNTISSSFINKPFVIRIKDEAKFHKAEFRITADSEIPIVMRDITFTCEILPASGIFIYDDEENNPANSGTFFRKYFTEEGPSVTYSTGDFFPSSLNNFDAVFLSYSNSDYPIYPSTAIKEYLEHGGRLYVESGKLFSGPYNKRAFALTGLKNVTLIDKPESRLDSLYGSENTITEGMVFRETDWQNINSIEVYEPNMLGKTFFTDANYGSVGIQAEGLNNQKTLLFSYPLSNLYDIDSVSNRVNLVSRIFSFFDLPKNFCANFESRNLKGRYPFKVKFYDLSMPDSGKQIVSRKWDFNNDGVIDSEEFYPEWTYPEPGVYTVTFEVSDGINTKTVTRENYITVLNEDTALEFNGIASDISGSLVTVTADSTLTVKSGFTIEAWIKPYEGNLASGIDVLFDKYSLSINFDNDQKSIALETVHDPWQYPMVKNSTPANSIVPGQWQHIAATYNAPLKEVKIFINGIEQLLELTGEVLDSLDDNSWSDFTIGRSPWFGIPFYGGVDEVRLWNVARTDEEILGSMNNALFGSEEGLILYFPLNEGSGDEVSDYSVFNHPTIKNNTTWIDGLTGILTSTKSEMDNMSIPDSYRLYQNYPNPFNPATIISYYLPKRDYIKLVIFDILGNEVEILDEGYKNPGFYRNQFDADKYASGIYIYSIFSSQKVISKKMLLLK